MFKKCTKCRIEKNLDDFGLCNKSKDKKKSECKDCRRIAGREYAKKRRQDPKIRQMLLKKTQEWRKKNQEHLLKYNRENYYKDIEKSRKKANEYYYRNRQECLIRQKIWRDNNPEFFQKDKNNARKRQQKYYSNNKDKCKVRVYAYRAKKQNATLHNFTFEEFNQRMSMFDNKCCYCGGPFEHVDHLKPLSLGGPHCLSNLRPSCRDCNLKKSNKPAKIWINIAKNT